MKNFILLITLLISLDISSQDKEIQYFDYKWKPVSENKAKFYREIIKQNDTLFSVTDYHDGRVYMRGQYFSVNPMLENGFFEFYDFDTHKKSASGYYSNGEMAGEWTIIDDKNEIKKVNYDFKPVETKEDTFNIPDSAPYIFMEVMPKFRGSDNMKAFSDYVSENTIYPPMAQKHFKEGKVYVRFTINSLGQIGDVEIIKKADKDLEREALRVITQATGWSPGYQEGKAV